MRTIDIYLFELQECNVNFEIITESKKYKNI